MGPNAYHEEGGVICVGGASGGVDILNTQTLTHRQGMRKGGLYMKRAGLDTTGCFKELKF